MKTLDLEQGSPAWNAHRANPKIRNASDAPVVMGASKHQTRSALLHRIATGHVEDVSPTLQALFDRGHAAEASIRPHVCKIVGEQMFPVTGTSDDYPQMSASFDGITMDETVIFEHKLLNAELFRSVTAGEELEPHYYWQIEHQLLVSGADKCIFVVSDGTPENMAHCWYTSQPERRAELLAGWAQFDKDLAAYVPEAAPAEVVGASVASLPALFVQIVGEVKSSNLVVYKASALAFIESINTDLQTDQDFADAEKVIKFCDSSEKELETVKKQALGQTASIDELFRTVDDLKAALRDKRLALDKLVKSRKDAIRTEILNAANNAIAAHKAEHNARFGREYMPPIASNVAEAMKGKKTVLSLKGAAADEVARVKIEADRIAKIIDANLATLREKAADHKFLFNDTGSLVLKDPEAVVAIVAQRIAEHTAEQARQAEALAEAAREKIRKEEQEKAEQAARDRAEEERKRRESEEAKERARIAAEQAAQIGKNVGDTLDATIERAAENFGGTEKTVVPSIVDDQVREIAQIPTPVVKPRVKLDPKRPPDADIVAAVMAHFSVDRPVAASWLLTMNAAELAKVAA